MIITSQCDQMIKQINTLKFNTLLKVIHVHLDLKKNLPNFSLEGPIIFLPLQFSYNTFPLCMSNCNPLLHY